MFVRYVINDASKSYPEYAFEVEATSVQLDELAERGFLVLRGVIPSAMTATFSAALDRVAAAESEHPATEQSDDLGHYVRQLLDKDEEFLELIRLEPLHSIARYMLGPQLCFGAEGRLAGAGNAVPWHIHLRVVPDPLPPFFSYPHALHALIYLDGVGPDEGPLRVLPGSHRDHTTAIPVGRLEDLPGQESLTFERGDVVLLHGNLWHSTAPTSKSGVRRRLILVGWQAAWITQAVTRGVAVEPTLTNRLRLTADDELRELLDGFHW